MQWTQQMVSLKQTPDLQSELWIFSTSVTEIKRGTGFILTQRNKANIDKVMFVDCLYLQQRAFGGPKLVKSPQRNPYDGDQRDEPAQQLCPQWVCVGLTVSSRSIPNNTGDQNALQTETHYY